MGPRRHERAEQPVTNPFYLPVDHSPPPSGLFFRLQLRYLAREQGEKSWGDVNGSQHQAHHYQAEGQETGRGQGAVTGKHAHLRAETELLMREYGALRNTDKVPMPPDTVQTMLLAAGVNQALDWPNSTGGAAATAVAAKAHLVRYTFCTTAGAVMTGMVNMNSTAANAPSSGSSATTGTSAGSTGNSIPVQGQGMYQVPSYSTGWSAAAAAACYVLAEIWKK